MAELDVVLHEFFENVLSQVDSMEYNALWRVRSSLLDFSKHDLTKDFYKSFDDENDLFKKIDNRYNDLVAEFDQKSKKIKKQKVRQKQRKFWEDNKKYLGDEYEPKRGNNKESGSKQVEPKIEVKAEEKQRDSMEPKQEEGESTRQNGQESSNDIKQEA